MKQAIVEENQNLIDVCLQVYGSLDYLLKLARDNNLSEGINHNIQAGDILLYDDIPPLADTSAAAVQRIYREKDLRIVTGAIPARKESTCGIPDGYCVFEFRWTATASFVAFFSKDVCRMPDEVSYREEISFAFWGQFLSDTYQAAYLFAQWVNAYYTQEGLVATNINDVVRIYIPKTWADCGQELFLCLYWTRKRDTDDPPDPIATSDYVEFFLPAGDKNSGYTECCDSYTVVDDSYDYIDTNPDNPE